MEIKRGGIYWVNLDPTVGSEIRKRRPCVVISVDPINAARRTVVVIPLSSSGKQNPPLVIGVNCLDKKAVAVLDQIRTVDKSRVLKTDCGQLNDRELEELEQSLKIVLGL